MGEAPDLTYLPHAASLQSDEDSDAVSLTYAGHTCSAEITVQSDESMGVRLSGGIDAEVPVVAHLVLKVLTKLHVGPHAYYIDHCEQNHRHHKKFLFHRYKSPA